MAEWLVEHGIGEDRAILVDGGEVLAAKLQWPEDLQVGATVEATLLRKVGGSRRGTALDELGNEILVDRIPKGVTEGSRLNLEITRAAIAERGRLKRAQGRVCPAGLEVTIAAADAFVIGDSVRRFPAGLWEDVWDNAATGEVSFAGGSLIFNVTAAMTVIDVDGDLPPRELALASVPVIACCLRQFDIGGSIGIDFPSIDAREDRKAVDAALADALADWPHERTAINGFGFVHIVARLQGPSLLHRFAVKRVGMAARFALRRAEMVEGPGVTLLRVHPAVEEKLAPKWLAELERRTGRRVRVKSDPALAIEAPHAQLVPS